jgi:uncharacterized protein
VDKLNRLKNILGEFKSVLVAFSGGVDSSFLLKAAGDALPKKDILAVTAVSETYTGSDLKRAKRFARGLGIKHITIRTEELKNRDFTKNDKDRCYHCKKELFRRLSVIAGKKNIRFVADASNDDDKKDYRPGSMAKKEFDVRSPLQEAGITKIDIRRYSKHLGLETWDLPSAACLASRIPYGKKIDKNTLKNIESAESFIRKLGIKQVRVRCHGNIARIETGHKDIKKFNNRRFCDRIIKHLKTLGFIYIVLDIEGYRTGSLNEVLK